MKELERIHNRAIIKHLEGIINAGGVDSYQDKKKFVFHGVSYINCTNKGVDIKQLQLQDGLIQLIIRYIGFLTPKEFMGMFPIEKDYDGDKWQTKDYFYTMEYICSTLDLDSPIGTENAIEFLMEYHNPNVRMFMVKLFSLASTLRKLDGGKGLMEELVEQNGVDTITLHKDGDKEFMIDKNGRTQRVFTGKRGRTHLRLVK